MARTSRLSLPMALGFLRAQAQAILSKPSIRRIKVDGRMFSGTIAVLAVLPNLQTTVLVM